MIYNYLYVIIYFQISNLSVRAEFLFPGTIPTYIKIILKYSIKRKPDKKKT